MMVQEADTAMCNRNKENGGGDVHSQSRSVHARPSLRMRKPIAIEHLSHTKEGGDGAPRAWYPPGADGAAGKAAMQSSVPLVGYEEDADGEDEDEDEEEEADYSRTSFECPEKVSDGRSFSHHSAERSRLTTALGAHAGKKAEKHRLYRNAFGEPHTQEQPRSEFSHRFSKGTGGLEKKRRISSPTTSSFGMAQKRLQPTETSPGGAPRSDTGSWLGTSYLGEFFQTRDIEGDKEESSSWSNLLGRRLRAASVRMRNVSLRTPWASSVHAGSLSQSWKTYGVSPDALAQPSGTVLDGLLRQDCQVGGSQNNAEDAQFSEASCIANLQGAPPCNSSGGSSPSPRRTNERKHSSINQTTAVSSHEEGRSISTWSTAISAFSRLSLASGMQLVTRLSRHKFNRRWVTFLLVFELIACCCIIRWIPYTEIDWKAYMQEVSGFLGGERNYYNLRGDTGPLVYPAGFVYIFSFLKLLTKEDPFVGQVIFAGLYLLHLALVLWVFLPTINKNTTIFSLVVLSKRLHSIFLLRCFNDGVAMAFAYASILAAQRRRWITCCVLFSLGVSVKMNVLLMAPALLWLLWEEASRRRVTSVVGYLSICAGVQCVLGIPFLVEAPVAYLARAFELTRVFNYRWTVNWKCIPETLFLSKIWALGLLMLHLTTLLFLWKRLWVKNRSLTLPEDVYKTYTAFVFFSCNFAGIVFARSLHYQFYAWYFPSIPFLLSHMRYKTVTKLCLFLALEYCWNVYPQRPAVSLLLQVVHAFLLIGVFRSPLKDFWRRGYLSAARKVPSESHF